VDSRTQRRHGDVSWFRLSEPYIQQLLFFVFKSTQIGGLQRKSKRFGRGSLGATLWLVGGEVASLAGEKNALLSCWVAGGEERFLSGCSALGAEV
jgi:hypothetical protein